MRKIFSLLAAVLFAGSMMASEAIMQYTGGVTTNMVGDGANNAATVGLDADLFTVLADKGANQNLPGLNKANDIRLYADKSTGNGNTITVSIASGTITSIVLDIKQNATFVVKAGETAVTEVDGAYAINATSFSIQNTTTGATTQLQLNKITITYESGDVPPTPTMDYYVAGSMTNWGPMAAYKLAANPANEGEYMGEFTFAANDEFKVGYSDGTTIESTNYFPNGMDNNYVITEAGDYTVYFRPDGQGGEGWHEGYINAVKKVIPQYEVAEAIAAGLTDNTEILVRGVITKMEFKGKNFAKYGSVNIYVADATNAEGEFEFYNCYSLNADTFRTSTPAYDAESNAWVEFEEVVDENGNAIHVGDTVIAFGKYKLFNETHELNTGCYLTEIKHPGDAPVEEDNVIYDWAGEIGTTILGATGVEVSTVKIHTNTDAVPAIKFGSSFVYDEGKWIAIKPAEGGFHAGDVLSVAAVFNNADDTKYAQIDLRAANGDTRIWLSDSASTINGRTQAGEPIVQTYTLEADQDSLFLGRYGNTGMFVTLINVVRGGEVVPPTPEHTYTVAGGSDVAFGTTWAPSNEANDMTLVEGLYTWEKADLTLAAGNIEFKVCEDHAWTTAYPAQNYQLNIPEAGIYTVTITFNAETKEVAAVATKTGEAVVIPTVAMHGNFLGSWADTENFAIAQDNASASLTLALAEGNYEFGMRIGGSGNWTANGANLTREANTTNLAEGSGNMHIAADVAGDYVFTYTYETQVLEVVYPEAPVVPDTIDVVATNVRWTDATASEGWWQITGVFGEYNFSISNISASQASGIYTMAEDLDPKWTYLKKYNEDHEVVDSIGFVDGQVEVAISADDVVTVVGALVGDNGNVYMFNLSYTDPVAETTVNIEIPEWQVVDTYFASYGIFVLAGQAANGDYVQLDLITDGATIAGVYTEEDEDPYEVYGSGIIAGGAQQGIFSFTATIAEQAENGRALVTADILCYNNTLYHVTTLVGEGVDALEAAQKAVKMIQNGQIVIIKNGVHYNINGAVIR